MVSNCARGEAELVRPWPETLSCKACEPKMNLDSEFHYENGGHYVVWFKEISGNTTKKIFL
jgi:hypothetical protein